MKPAKATRVSLGPNDYSCSITEPSFLIRVPLGALFIQVYPGDGTLRLQKGHDL